MCDSCFEGKDGLVSGGGRIEVIDGVRFVCNGSCGKMGYGIGEGLGKRGGKVRVVGGGREVDNGENVEVI
ncbi:phosphopantothenoylcysteine decarboxylase domain-containing protein, partial [Staphylococcus hominis]|uniref:phosphopantothenoylcysteine decarboxylase domain-containing protein n=1 Tax=Staphylococcus hominis TaxID=1290 RepID=UPI0037095906